MAAKHMRVVDEYPEIPQEREISGFRVVVGTILIALSVALIAYTIGIGLYRASAVVAADATRKMMMYELIIWAALLVVAVDIRSGFLTKLRFFLFKAIGWVLRIAAALLVFCALGSAATIMVQGSVTDAGKTEAAVVFGMALENGRANHDLELRVDKAVAYAKDNPTAKLYLSGGLATENSPSEASVMREMLVSAGVAEDRLIIDEEATNTIQNLVNTAAKVDTSAPITLITNNFHMMRCMKLAKIAEFKDPRRLPASADLLTLVFDLMSEAVGEVNTIGQALPFLQGR